MALRDSFGFNAMPRAGLEVALQQERSRPEAVASVFGRVRFPEVRDSASHEHALKKLSTIKDTLRSDAPASHADRRWLWIVASGAYSKFAQSNTSFAEYAQKAASLKPEVVVLTDTDVRSVGLTFRQHPMYRQASGISAMSNVLIALLASNVKISYSRSLAHMVAFTMVVFGGPEYQEMVFWTLKAFLEDRMFGYCDGQWQMGVRVEQEVLGRLAARKLPRLTAHLASLRLSVASFTQPWLAGLFVSHLPPETLARVWDVAMCEGPKVMLRMGLALLKMYEQTLTSCTFPEVLRKVLDLRVSRTTDAPGLLSAAFKCVGSLPGMQVDAVRHEVMRTLLDQAAPGTDGLGFKRPASPGAVSTSLSGSGTSRVLFGVGAISFRSRATTNSTSAAGSAGSSPPSDLHSVFTAPSSPDNAAAAVLVNTTSAAASSTRTSRSSLVTTQLSSMLSRLLNSVKSQSHGDSTTAAPPSADALPRHVSAGSSVPELAAC